MDNVYLGKDIKLSNSADVMIGSNQDFIIAHHHDNLAQAIIMRISTAKGELELHPDYGSELFLVSGESRDEFVLSEIENVVFETLLQETRIEQVISVTATLAAELSDTIEISISVIPIEEQSELNIIFPYILQ